jgi:hypothetical protein
VSRVLLPTLTRSYHFLSPNKELRFIALPPNWRKEMAILEGMDMKHFMHVSVNPFFVRLVVLTFFDYLSLTID